MKVLLPCLFVLTTVLGQATKRMLRSNNVVDSALEAFSHTATIKDYQYAYTPINFRIDFDDSVDGKLLPIPVQSSIHADIAQIGDFSTIERVGNVELTEKYVSLNFTLTKTVTQFNYVTLSRYLGDFTGKVAVYFDDSLATVKITPPPPKNPPYIEVLEFQVLRLDKPHVISEGFPAQLKTQLEAAVESHIVKDAPRILHVLNYIVNQRLPTNITLPTKC